MFKKIWKCLFGYTSDGDKYKDTNWDNVAKSFIDQFVSTGSTVDDDGIDDNLVEDLDVEHLNKLAHEIDPLEDIVEIPQDSIQKIDAKMPYRGQKMQFLKTNGSTEIIRSDRVQRNNSNLHTVDQRTKKYENNTPIKKRSRHSFFSGRK